MPEWRRNTNSERIISGCKFGDFGQTGRDSTLREEQDCGRSPVADTQDGLELSGPDCKATRSPQEQNLSQHSHPSQIWMTYHKKFFTINYSLKDKMSFFQLQKEKIA